MGWVEVLAGLISPAIASSALLARSHLVRKVLGAIFGHPSIDSQITAESPFDREGRL